MKPKNETRAAAKKAKPRIPKPPTPLALDEEVADAVDLLQCETNALADALSLVARVRQSVKAARGEVAKEQASAVHDEAVVNLLIPTLLRSIDDAIGAMENRQCEVFATQIHTLLRKAAP